MSNTRWEGDGGTVCGRCSCAKDEARGSSTVGCTSTKARAHKAPEQHTVTVQPRVGYGGYGGGVRVRSYSTSMEVLGGGFRNLQARGATEWFSLGAEPFDRRLSQPSLDSTRNSPPSAVLSALQ
jgi:hypothetical protein